VGVEHFGRVADPDPSVTADREHPSQHSAPAHQGLPEGLRVRFPHEFPDVLAGLARSGQLELGLSDPNPRALGQPLKGGQVHRDLLPEVAGGEAYRLQASCVDQEDLAAAVLPCLAVEVSLEAPAGHGHDLGNRLQGPAARLEELDRDHSPVHDANARTAASEAEGPWSKGTAGCDNQPEPGA